MKTILKKKNKNSGHQTFRTYLGFFIRHVLFLPPFPLWLPQRNATRLVNVSFEVEFPWNTTLHGDESGKDKWKSHVVRVSFEKQN